MAIGEPKKYVTAVFALGLLLQSQNGMANSAPAVDPYAASPLFTLSAAQSSYANAQSIEVSAISGTWNLYGVVDASGAPPVGDINGYSANGLRNGDGSYRTELVFEGTGVSIENLGFAGMNQGPNPVQFNPDGSLTFSQYAYQSSDFEASPATGQTYFATTCKSAQSSQNPRSLLLICALTLQLAASSTANSNPQDVSANGTIIAYHAYVKSNPSAAVNLASPPAPLTP